MILFVVFFFFSIRPTDSISGNAFDAKRNFEFAQQRNRHLELGDPQKVRNFVFLGPTIFDHLRGRVYGLEFLDNYGKLSTDFEIACTSLF